MADVGILATVGLWLGLTMQMS